MVLRTAQFPIGHFSDGAFPTYHWPGLPGGILNWIAGKLHNVDIAGQSYSLNIIQPEIIDPYDSIFSNGDCILLGIKENINEVTTSSRFRTLLARVYGIISSTLEPADKALSRIIETVRKTLLGSNIAGGACNGLAISIDCPDSRFYAWPGMVIAEIDILVEYDFTV